MNKQLHLGAAPVRGQGNPLSGMPRVGWGVGLVAVLGAGAVLTMPTDADDPADAQRLEALRAPLPVVRDTGALQFELPGPLPIVVQPAAGAPGVDSADHDAVQASYRTHGG